MIDFRYHLVSLMSVFIALAIGIVLGSGPLGDSIGNSVDDQVVQLRDDKRVLREDNAALETDQMQLAQFVEASGPQLVSGTLDGTGVAIVTEHDSSREDVDEIAALVAAAGGEVTLEVTLQGMLWDPTAASQRADAVADLEAVAPRLVEDGADPAATLTTAIGAAVADDDVLDEGTREAVWGVLVDQGVVVVTGDPAATTDAVSYVGADPSALLVPTEDAAAAEERAQSLLAIRTAMMTSLVATGVPTVASAPTPEDDSGSGVLGIVRSDAELADLSTSDRLQEPDGPVIAVLALGERMRGGVGHYGTAADADAQVPEVDRSIPLTEDGAAGDGTGTGGTDPPSSDSPGSDGGAG